MEPGNDSFGWVSGYLGIWVSGYLGIWVPGTALIETQQIQTQQNTFIP